MNSKIFSDLRMMFISMMLCGFNQSFAAGDSVVDEAEKNGIMHDEFVDVDVEHGRDIAEQIGTVLKQDAYLVQPSSFLSTVGSYIWGGKKSATNTNLVKMQSIVPNSLEDLSNHATAKQLNLVLNSQSSIDSEVVRLEIVAYAPIGIDPSIDSDSIELVMADVLADALNTVDEIQLMKTEDINRAESILFLRPVRAINELVISSQRQFSAIQNVENNMNPLLFMFLFPHARMLARR